MSTSGYSVVGIDIGGTKVAAAVLRYTAGDAAAPQVLERTSIATEAQRGGDDVLARVAALAVEVVGRCAQLPDADRYPLVGVGAAAAGKIDARTGAVVYANDIMPGWTGQPLAERLAHDTGLPAAALNDVQGHALGEARFGAACGHETCIMVAAGTGLGGALIVDGHVVRGAHGFAGELGHTLSPAAAGIVCACGAVAHLESVASGSGIEARYAEATGCELDGAAIAQRAWAGEEAAAAVIRRAGYALGESIASWSFMLDPEVVVLSGSVVGAGAAWRAALDEGYASQVSPGQQLVPIVEARLGSDAPLVGAAEHLLDTIGRPSDAS